MVAFGGPSGLFLSHIPMMQPPHALQVVLRVGPPPGQQFNDGLYTFVPKPFDSNKLLDGTLKELEGTFFKGNFEAGGTPHGVKPFASTADSGYQAIRQWILDGELP